MKLNVGMMVDGNSRFAFLDVMRRNGLGPEDLQEPQAREAALAVYAERLAEVYVENARWCVKMGEEVLSRVEDSDYSIFIYNVTNRARDHFACIDSAIRTVSGELIERLGEFGPIALIGPEREKRHWFSLFPKYSELAPPRSGNRTVLMMGYQHVIGEDPHTANMRPIDYFLRSTQMRFSGMYLPALANSQFIVMTHIPYMYSPSEVAETLVMQKELDEEHDELNLYSPRVYQEWMEHYNTEPSLIATSNALPPKVLRLSAAVPAVPSPSVLEAVY